MKPWLSITLFALATWLPGPAVAADYPSQSVRIVVPFAPGGGTDLAARAIAEKLTTSLGKPVVVENRPGGNSVIASQIVATAPADGHTLLLTTDIHAINAAYAAPLPYDSLKDFAFVAQLTTSPLMLVAHPSSGVQTVADLVRRAKAEPRRLSFASLGPSSPHHLGFEWFERMAGIDVVDVPYKGGGQALADTLGGQVELSLIVAGNGIRQARAGKLNAVAVTSPQRTAIAPDVPTVAESGYPDFAIVNWYAILAPAGTAPGIVDRLNREIRRALSDKAVIDRLVGAGLEPTTGSPAELEALVRRDVDKYRRIIALTGAKLE
ncbi:MAG TPA: tripartite tricarboxylate transporter substrate binding protein [Burkholderiaceae bacterium]|jgi:tripartite-type tricarboxylate transporter receptor subunit TctC|nr:tripartite tricarboxylate transporter substrate binding protein [Burkholderiaceae bacterium]